MNRDCSKQLEAALACWAAGAPGPAEDLYRLVPDALGSHQGLGDARSWLAGACIFEPLRKIMESAGVQDLSDVLTCPYEPVLAWLAHPDACAYVALRVPGFLAALVEDGPPDEAMFFDDGRNFEIGLDYFPASVRCDAEQAYRAYYAWNGDDWAAALANAACALSRHCPDMLPESCAGAAEFLDEAEASPAALMAFRTAASNPACPRAPRP